MFFQPFRIPRAILTEARATLVLAGPIIGAQLAQMSMIFVDNIMIGHLGARPLATMALAIALLHALLLFCIGTLTVVSPFVSQAFGAGKPAEAGTVLFHGLFLTLLLSAAIIFILQFAPELLRLLGQEKDLIPQAHLYIQAVCWGIPAKLGCVALRQFVEGTSNSRPSLLVAGFGALINIAADYVLIFGKFGAPALGVLGAGIATTVVSWAMFLVFWFYVRQASRYRNFDLRFRIQNLRVRLIRDLLKIGIPLGGMYALEVAFFAACTLLMGTIGHVALASHQIALNAASFTFMMPLGLSMAVGVRVGQFVGQENRIAARRAGNVGLLLGVLLMSVPALVFWFRPQFVLRVYTNAPELISFGANLLFIAAIFQIFDGLQVVGIGILRGFKDTRWPLFVTLISYWIVGFPTGYFLTFKLGMGPKGLWWGMVLGLGTAAILYRLRFQRIVRRLLSFYKVQTPVQT